MPSSSIALDIHWTLGERAPGLGTASPKVSCSARRRPPGVAREDDLGERLERDRVAAVAPDHRAKAPAPAEARVVRGLPADVDHDRLAGRHDRAGAEGV